MLQNRDLEPPKGLLLQSEQGQSEQRPKHELTFGSTNMVRNKYTFKLQMESANLSSTTDESRVQLMSLEYDELRLA